MDCLLAVDLGRACGQIWERERGKAWAYKPVRKYTLYHAIIHTVSCGNTHCISWDCTAWVSVPTQAWPLITCLHVLPPAGYPLAIRPRDRSVHVSDLARDKVTAMLVS